MFTRLWVDMRDILSEMVVQENWEERMAKDGELVVPHVVDLTLRMALAAIARMQRVRDGFLLESKRGLYSCLYRPGIEHHTDRTGEK